MGESLHHFHVPVMGTGFTIDAPLRIGRFGIASVMSLVDDHLIERVRRYYLRQRGQAVDAIGARAPDSRARRITAWLDLVADLLDAQMAALRAQPFEAGSEKSRYFELLPDDVPAKAGYLRLLALPAGAERDALAAELTSAIRPGAIDVNIMTKLDRLGNGPDGLPRPPGESDAKAAVRGIARSRFTGSLVLSAGVNPSLFAALEEWPSFARDEDGRVRHGLILKVSDLRSAVIQGKLLAKKGLEVREFRVESGLNCGGHAFATEGELLGPILRELQEGRDAFPGLFEPLIERALASRGRTMHPSARGRRILVTAQGGLGTHGETRRLLEDYGCDATGWATPFLLVPEVTRLDRATRAALTAAGPDNLYLSEASPLGIPFNNLRGSSSERWHAARVAAGQPGSDCSNGYCTFDAGLTGEALCTASSAWQGAKLARLGYDAPPTLADASAAARAVYVKACLCTHLANGALIELGLARDDAPVAVCPGPNLEWFDRTYTLEEMVDHIYGRAAVSLVPLARPHVFAKELELYVDDYERKRSAANDPRARRALDAYRQNLEAGLAHLRILGTKPAFQGENLASLREAVQCAEERLRILDDRAAPPSASMPDTSTLEHPRAAGGGGRLRLNGAPARAPVTRETVRDAP